MKKIFSLFIALLILSFSANAYAGLQTIGGRVIFLM